MNKQKLLRIINVILGALFLIVIISVSLYRIIPSSLNGNVVLYKIHAGAGVSLFIVVLLHLWLNWLWIRQHYFSRK